MADATLNKLVELIASQEPVELRQAALRVVGHVAGVPHKPLVKALLESLKSEAPELRQEAIRAVGLLRIEEALPALENFVRQAGSELEVAVQAAGQLGAKGSKSMGRLMDEAAPVVRSRVAAVLAKSGTGNAVVVTAHALLDADPKVAVSAARSLALEVPNFSSAQKQSLGKFLIEALEAKEERPAATEAGLIRVLAALQDPKAEEVFWARLAPSRPRDVRAAALQGLGHAPKLSEGRLQKVLACAADRDFQIVAAALMILKEVPTQKKNLKPWLELLKAPDVATRRFAVDKLRGMETAEVAQALLPQMQHADRGLREDVQRVLGSFAAGREALLEKLLAAQQADEAWSLARALAPLLHGMTPEQCETVFDEACTYQDKDDRRAAPLWFLLRELQPRWTRDQIEERALALRKKKKYAESLVYFRLLIQDPACSEDVRFEFAATGLKTSSHDLALDSRQNDFALTQFARLLQNAAFDLFPRISKAKWLDAEDLFYLGFHFIEQTHRARDFGKQVLELVVEKSGKTELGKSAKRKLKSEAAD